MLVSVLYCTYQQCIFMEINTFWVELSWNNVTTSSNSQHRGDASGKSNYCFIFFFYYGHFNQNQHDKKIILYFQSDITKTQTTVEVITLPKQTLQITRCIAYRPSQLIYKHQSRIVTPRLTNSHQISLQLSPHSVMIAMKPRHPLHCL